MDNFKAKVAGFYELIERGKFLEALDAYYANNISSADNDGPPIVGLTALHEAVTGFLDRTTDMKIVLENSLVAEGYSAAQWHYRFTNSRIGAVDYRQISVAHWEDGKITKEQHLYSLKF